MAIKNIADYEQRLAEIVFKKKPLKMSAPITSNTPQRGDLFIVDAVTARGFVKLRAVPRCPKCKTKKAK